MWVFHYHNMKKDEKMRVLIVEDERDLNHTIGKVLKKEGYQFDACYDGEEAWDYIEVYAYDVILLDIMMPRLDGLSLLKRIRQKGLQTKVILLTAKDALEDKIAGLDLGADDYIVKPFAFGELLARIRVLIRQNSGNASNTITIDDVEIDTMKKTVHRSGVFVELTAKEYEVFLYLARNKNAVISREQILDNVWDADYDGMSNIVDVIIKNIRKKLTVSENDTPIIQTKRGLGYVIFS